MRLWIDECLSPTLVQAARRRYEATCNDYRGLLRAADTVLYAVVSAEEWVFVTNNHRDFRSLTARAGRHFGLVLLPQRFRSEQPPMLEGILDYIERCSANAGLHPAVWMVNRVVEYHDEDDSVSGAEWPPRASSS